MTFSSGSLKPLSAFSLAGLTDIVLLLLIFFLLTSSFVTQFGIQVNLPRAEAGAAANDTYVTVSITEEGEFYVDQARTPREELVGRLQEALTSERTALLLRADESVTLRDFAYVANIAKALDLRVLMATEREQR